MSKWRGEGSVRTHSVERVALLGWTGLLLTSSVWTVVCILPLRKGSNDDAQLRLEGGTVLSLAKDMLSVSIVAIKTTPQGRCLELSCWGGVGTIGKKKKKRKKVAEIYWCKRDKKPSLMG